MPLCAKHNFLNSLLSLSYSLPPPESSQVTRPVPSLFYLEKPMFCTNSYAISSSIYFIIGSRLVNAKLAKSFGKKKRIGLLKCTGQKNVWAKTKRRLQGEGRNERWHLGPDPGGVVREVPPCHSLETEKAPWVDSLRTQKPLFLLS